MPDLIVLDVSLPGPLSGLHVCRALRADAATAAVPVLMVSAWAFDTDVETGYADGADGYWRSRSTLPSRAPASRP
jgi:two-component system, OmpR family, phosphate regulon response regulator PhoB